jgi:hypothetical protein
VKFTSFIKLVAVVSAVGAALVVAVPAGAATAELFAATGAGSSPRDIAIDQTGNIYTANGNRTVSKITSAGVVTAAWATTLENAGSITTHFSGGVYVGASAGTDANKIQKLTDGSLPGNYVTSTTGGTQRVNALAVDASGNMFYTNPTYIGKIMPLSAPPGSARSITPSYQPGAVATDPNGNIWVVDQNNDKVWKYDVNLSTSTGYSVGDTPRSLAVDQTYLYVSYEGSGSGTDGGVSRIKLSDNSVTAAWASGFPANRAIAVSERSGTVFVTGTQMGQTRLVTSITSSGTASTVATLSFDPGGLVVDSSGNVYTTNMGSGYPLMTAGVYKITMAAPTPTPTPSSNSSSTTTTTTTAGKPAPGPALKVTDIPAEITLDLGSSTGGAIPADQPIVAEVPCSAPEGQLLDRCTVNVTAPEYVLLGQGDGISVRSDKKVSIGKATVKSKAGKKTIVVKVKINPKGRKALQRNLKITATVGLTAITVSNLKSSGEANTEMRLPTQLISPQSGIFDSNSVSLNKAGVAFVNALPVFIAGTKEWADKFTAAGVPTSDSDTIDGVRNKCAAAAWAAACAATWHGQRGQMFTSAGKVRGRRRGPMAPPGRLPGGPAGQVMTALLQRSTQALSPMPHQHSN